MKAKLTIAVIFSLGAIIALCCTTTGHCGSSSFRYKWIFVRNKLNKDIHVDEIRNIAKVASEHGFNGLVLNDAGVDRLDLNSAEHLRRLKMVKQICESNHIDFIPTVFSVGYGYNVLAHDWNLAVGFQVKDALFVVENGFARPLKTHEVEVVNGGFEKYENNRAGGHIFHDLPGQASFIDKKVYFAGRASLRFEHSNKHKPGMGRVWRVVKVQPYKRYRLICYVKTEEVIPTSGLMVQVYSKDKRRLGEGFLKMPIKSTSDWTRVEYRFNSQGNSEVRFFIGIWGWGSGRLWIDEISIEQDVEQELVNVLRRPGTPLGVRSAATSKLYEEGRDFEPVEDQELNFRFDHEPPRIRIKPDGGIVEGENLLVSYYHGTRLGNGQVSVCMSDPKVYEIWEHQLKLIEDLLKPTHYLLAMDEIRQGGTCEACRRRNIPMAEILGDCITKQYKMIKEVNPRAKVFIWADMLDPNHNAKKNYYMMEGDLSGSWNHVPKEIIMVCWGRDIREASLKHFMNKGFGVLGATYYDTGSMKTTQECLNSLSHVGNALGIMYTTWTGDYSLLLDFSETVGIKAWSSPPFLRLRK